VRGVAAYHVLVCASFTGVGRYVERVTVFTGA